MTPEEKANIASAARGATMSPYIPTRREEVLSMQMGRDTPMSSATFDPNRPLIAQGDYWKKFGMEATPYLYGMGEIGTPLMIAERHQFDPEMRDVTPLEVGAGLSSVAGPGLATAIRYAPRTTAAALGLGALATSASEAEDQDPRVKALLDRQNGEIDSAKAKATDPQRPPSPNYTGDPDKDRLLRRDYNNAVKDWQNRQLPEAKKARDNLDTTLSNLSNDHNTQLTNLLNDIAKEKAAGGNSRSPTSFRLAVTPFPLPVAWVLQRWDTESGVAPSRATIAAFRIGKTFSRRRRTRGRKTPPPVLSIRSGNMLAVLRTRLRTMRTFSRRANHR
jgi:hypothetical protein